MILPTVGAEAFSIALENFAREVGAGKRRRILLVADQGRMAHRKEETKGARRDTSGVSSPALSGAMQPSESLWPLSNEGVANRHFEEIEELEKALVERCIALCDQPEVIRSYIRYHWWPNAA